jgi:hypothetical protein
MPIAEDAIGAKRNHPKSHEREANAGLASVMLHFKSWEFSRDLPTR